MVDGFFRKIAEAALGSNNDEDQQVRPASEDPYGDPADAGTFGDVRPASEDPYGDPADTGMFGNVRPASEDPYGDPADAGMFGNVRPASEDPYGDPADAGTFGSGSGNEEYYEDENNDRRNSW